ncbi:MAG: hypothetical protein V1858_03655 [Candidatus Gottesmanbacteria bacterium]
MQNKKKLIIAVIGLGILLIISFSYIFFKKIKTNDKALTLSVNPSETKISLKTFNDETGFQFQYPEDLLINDVSGDDQNIYSALEISSSDKDNKMIIRITDTDIALVDEWLKTKEGSGAGPKREISIATMSGKQIQFKNPNRLVSLVINDGIMYFFESPLDEAGYWNKIHNIITSSFSIVEVEESVDSSTESTSNDEGILTEEEEVIE